MIRIIIFVGILFFTGFQQNVVHRQATVCPAGFYFLNYTNQLPEDLLAGKSVVFVDVPGKNGPSTRGNWKNLAETTHATFKEVGIDAVAYYNRQDIFAGEDAIGLFAGQMKQRQIDNIIYVSEQKNEGSRGGTLYKILVTSFNQKDPFVTHHQNAWMGEHENINALLHQLQTQVEGSGLARKNFLINDKPEYFSKVQIIKGNRFERFMPDLKLDNLAIPAFGQPTIPSNYPRHPVNEKLASAVDALRESVKAKNDTLKAIMELYPYDHGIVADSIKEDQLLNDEGYQFVLRYLHTTIGNIKNWMGYQGPDNSEVAVWGEENNNSRPAMESLDSLNDKKVVYKYYVKHIYTGDVYLGNTWDGAIKWQDALRQHWQNLNEALETGS